MLKCSFCGVELTMLPSGVAVACGCSGAQTNEAANKERIKTWNNSRQDALHRAHRRRDRGRRGST
jgi:hypothetical protein